MKYLKNKLRKLSIIKRQSILIICTFLYFNIIGCVKDTKLYSPEEGTIYMPQAYADKANLSLYKLDSNQNITFGAAYSGFGAATSSISAQFKIDTSLITQYNSDYAYLGNHYVVLPDSAYSIPSLNTEFKQGSSSSDPLSLLVNTSKLALGTHYLLPIRLTSVSKGIFDTSLSIAYFKIDTLTVRSRDITGAAKYTYNYDDAPSYGDAGESAIHLVDSSIDTKYLLFNFHSDMYVQLQYPTPTVINAYTLTSAGDASERDPRSWNLVGSDDGVTWTVLDKRSDELFSDRNQTREFVTNNNSAYNYYRLNITNNNNGGTGLFQCAEWRMLQFY